MGDDILTNTQLQAFTMESNSRIGSNTSRSPNFIRDTNELKAHKRINLTLNQSANSRIVNRRGFLVFQQVFQVSRRDSHIAVFFGDISFIHQRFDFNQFINVKDSSRRRVNNLTGRKFNFRGTIVTCFSLTQSFFKQLGIDSTTQSISKGLSCLVGRVNQQFNTVIIFNQISQTEV